MKLPHLSPQPTHSTWNNWWRTHLSQAINASLPDASDQRARRQGVKNGLQIQTQVCRPPCLSLLLACKNHMHLDVQDGDREEAQLKDLTPNPFLGLWSVGKGNTGSLPLHKFPRPSQGAE